MPKQVCASLWLVRTFAIINKKPKVLVEQFTTNSMTKFYVIIFAFLLFACNRDVERSNTYQNIRGEAQGTTYSITIDTSGAETITKEKIDSIFARIDSSLSVWKNNSVISVFNSLDSIKVDDPHFLTIYYRSAELSELTEGAFNARIAPLVKAWGFGKNGIKPKSEISPDSLLELVHTEISTVADSLDEAIIFTKLPGQSLDVNGIAQGYTVDVIGDFLRSKGSDNFMVEVGGEVSAEGKNEKNESWKIGIDKPLEDLSQRELEAVAEVSGRALATSGSYRKFYELNGNKYSHTINPKTGYPVDHRLLSASVLSSNCTNADAFATAFMVMGKNKTLEFVESHPELNLDVFLIFSKDDGELGTEQTAGFKLSR